MVYVLEATGGQLKLVVSGGGSGNAPRQLL